MKKAAQAISALALGATLLPSVLFFLDVLPLSQVRGWMLASALLWFASAPLWMGRKNPR